MYADASFWAPLQTDTHCENADNRKHTYAVYDTMAEMVQTVNDGHDKVLDCDDDSFFLV